MSALYAYVCPECGAQTGWNERHLRLGRTTPYDWCPGHSVKIEVVSRAVADELVDALRAVRDKPDRRISTPLLNRVVAALSKYREVA